MVDTVLGTMVPTGNFCFVFESQAVVPSPVIASFEKTVKFHVTKGRKEIQRGGKAFL